MKQVICDRCGKVIDYSQGVPVFVVIRSNTNTFMDMCKECRVELVDFMHGAKVSFPEDEEREAAADEEEA